MLTPAQKAFAIAAQAGVTPLAWGAPGIGKSAFVRSLARALGAHLEVIVPSLREPSDLLGLPMRTEEGTAHVPPAWAVRSARAQRAVVFIDELTTAPPAVAAALMGVILDRRVGEFEFPDTVSIVAAANPPEQAPAGMPLPAPLANRVCHLDWGTPDPRAWATALMRGFEGEEERIPLLPPDIDLERGPERARARQLVAAFIMARPHLLHALPRTEEEQGRAWPSPRSWDLATRLLAAAWAAGAGEEVEFLLLAGMVGEGAALEFAAYVRELDLPDPEALLADPDRAPLPARGDLLLAALGGAVAAAVRELTPPRWAAAWRLLARAAREVAPDVAAAAATDLARARRPDLPLPAEIREFLPVLREAGLVGGGR